MKKICRRFILFISGGLLTTGFGLPEGPENLAIWQPDPQPNLEARLNSAPTLELESIAVSPQTARCGHRPYLVPNRDGQSWDMVYPYFKQYRHQQQVFMYDFGSENTAI